MARTHYTPAGGSYAWCGRVVGFHAAVPATTHAERVTCKVCLRVMARFKAGVEISEEARKSRIKLVSGTTREVRAK